MESISFQPVDLAKAPNAKIAVIYRSIRDLKPDPKNPRVHTKHQVRQIARSIEAFGFNVPVLIDGGGNVIAGHGRVLACKTLGQSEVPTICLDHLTPVQAKAFMIADNRLSENSSWDEQLLSQSLKELSSIELDFQIDVTGFDMGEIDVRIESLDQPSSDKPDSVDQFMKAKEPAVTQEGDLWLLGKHRILCGNSLLPENYSTLMAGKLATIVFEDPPYNVKIQGHVGGKGKIRHREFAMAVGEMTQVEFTSFLKTAMQLAHDNAVDGSLHFICMDFRHMQEMLGAGGAVYGELKNLCVWVKNVGGMGSLYRSRYELVFVFKKGTAPHINNVELGRHGRYRTNVWEHRSIVSSRHTTDEGDLLALHPTVKPVRLVADAILDCSKRGNIVLDAFLGSGSTLVAAQRTGRICYGLELDPLYVDTAIRRWQADTGGDAVHAVSGQTFAHHQANVKERAQEVALKVVNKSEQQAQHDAIGTAVPQVSDPETFHA